MGIKDEILKYTDKKNRVIAITLFFLFGIYYSVILFIKVPTDIQAHIMVSYEFANNYGPLTPNFLYFILVAALAGFSKYKLLYYGASIFLLALALGLKYIVNVFYLNKIEAGRILPAKQIIFLAVAMLFIFCLPGIDFFKSNGYYLGQSVSNVWHNSTVIFLFPFAVMLFFEAYNLLTSSKKKNGALL